MSPAHRKPSHPAYVRYRQAIEEAAAEGGPVVARVFCARCGDSGTLATVRRHDRWGRIFEARLARSVSRDDLAELEGKADAGRRVPATVGICRHLLDFPAEVPGPVAAPHRQDDPAAECPRCGVDAIDREELKAKSAGRRPGVVTIHRGPEPTI